MGKKRRYRPCKQLSVGVTCLDLPLCSENGILCGIPSCVPSWCALFCGSTARALFRGEKSILLFNTRLYSEGVILRCTGKEGKLPLGLRNSPSSLPIFFSQWYQAALECGCKDSLSMRTALDDPSIRLGDLFVCGLLCLSVSSFLPHPSVRCWQRGPAVLRSALLPYCSAYCFFS